MNETVPVGILFLCVLVLFGVILFLVSVIVEERKNPPAFPQIAHPLLTTFQTNRMFTGFEDVDFVVISLPKRHTSHYMVLEQSLAAEKIQTTWFEAIDGKTVDLDTLHMTPSYRQFFLNNTRELAEGKTTTNYRGHIGATLSHFTIYQNVKNMTVIFEDDVDHHHHFRNKFQAALASVTRLDPNWDILLLGMTAAYNDYAPHKLNDREPVYEGGIVRVRAHIGGWAYVIRSAQVAQKIVQCLQPLFWHIDLALSQLNRDGKLAIYGCIPTLCDHAGSLRCSSWNWTGVGRSDTLKSDTNN